MRTTAILSLILISSFLYSQSIFQLEYFVDNDPGFGNGQPVSFTQGDIITANFTADISGLNPGLHVLYTRVQDSDGKWSHATYQLFIVDNIQSGPLSEIVYAEYYFNNDPGLSNGIPISPAPSVSLNSSFVADLSSLNDGIHVLYTRVLDARGNWSLTHFHPFYMEATQHNPKPFISEVEFFVNSDPGFGNGTFASFEEDSNVLAGTFVDLTGLNPGNHTLYMRAKDENGNWGVTHTETFAICPESMGLNMNLKVILEGAYRTNVSSMGDELRQDLLIPFNEPYSEIGYVYTGEGGVESIGDSMLQVTGNDAIADWVIVELRDKLNPAIISSSVSALLQSDGDIVNPGGNSELVFPCVPNDSFYVAVRHRNHLGVMTAEAMALSSNVVTIDFSDPATQTFGTEAQRPLDSNTAMWAGNVVPDNELKYAGPLNDRDPILVRIGGTVPTATFDGYLMEDANLDGEAKYAGPSNDRDIILVNIGGAVPTNVRDEQLP